MNQFNYAIRKIIESNFLIKTEIHYYQKIS